MPPPPYWNRVRGKLIYQNLCGRPPCPRSYGPDIKKLLTSRAGFLLVDGPNVHGLRYTLQSYRIVPT